MDFENISKTCSNNYRKLKCKNVSNLQIYIIKQKKESNWFGDISIKLVKYVGHSAVRNVGFRNDVDHLTPQKRVMIIIKAS